jgi:hypothetical protein
VTTLFPSLDSIPSALNLATCLLLLLSLFYLFSLSFTCSSFISQSLDSDSHLHSWYRFTHCSFIYPLTFFIFLSQFQNLSSSLLYSQLIAIVLTKYSYQISHSYIQLSILIRQSYTTSIRLSLQHISITNIDNCFPCKQQFDHFTTFIIAQYSKK